jgi:hypothetical protein
VNNLVMIFYSGMFLIGKLDERKLLEPRSYSLQNIGGEIKHMLSPLPGMPMLVSLPRDVLYWPIADKDILGLYVKTISRIELVQ